MPTELELAKFKLEVLDHIHEVQRRIEVFIGMLSKRALRHDETKLESPEIELFAEHSQRAAFGSEEYYQRLEQLKPALDHHYKHSRHHPQAFKDGIAGMNLVDLVEMYIDWTVRARQDESGNVYGSVKHNAERFDMPDMLRDIFLNTADIIQ